MNSKALLKLGNHYLQNLIINNPNLLNDELGVKYDDLLKCELFYQDKKVAEYRLLVDRVFYH